MLRDAALERAPPDEDELLRERLEDFDGRVWRKFANVEATGQ